MLTDEVVKTIARNQKKMASWPWALIACFFLWPFTAAISPWLFLIWIVFSIWLTVFLHEKDNKRRRIYVEYPDTVKSDPHFAESRTGFEKLIASQRIWQIVSSSTVEDRKHNAGANMHIRRWGAKAGYGLPKLVTSNIKVPFLKGSRAIYFFPDAILICDRKGCVRTSYNQVRIDTSTTRFIEGTFYPREAPLLEHTWQVVNAKGGRDKRVKNNRKLPVVRYDVLNISCEGVCEEKFHLSAPGSANTFAHSIGLLQGASLTRHEQEMPSHQFISQPLPGDIPMATRRQVHCVTRGTMKQGYEKITHIGGIYADGRRWQETTEEAVRMIIAKECEFFVSNGENQVDVIVGKYLDRFYLKTEADSTEGNNLSSLPECPALTVSV